MIKKLLITACLFLTLLCGTAFAESVTIGWDANTDDIDGYMVYRARISGDYVFGDPGPNFVGLVPCTANDPVCCEFTTETLDWETTYYWVVTAFSGPGGESGPSNEVTHTTPVQPVSPPADPTGCYIKTVVP